jgi:O-antigen/teichoic acid export membrane protein
MSLKQKAVKGIVWSAIQKLGGQAISFIVFSLLARLLAPADFGLVAMASVYLAFLQVFVDQGYAEAIVQRQTVDKEHLDTAFWVSISTSILLTIASIVAAKDIATAFKTPELAPVIAALSPTFLFAALNSVQRALFSRRLEFKAMAARTLAASTAGGIVGVILAVLGYGVWSLVWQQLVNGVVGVLVLWKASDWQPGFHLSFRHLKELSSFSANILGFNILNFFNRRADDFLIGYYLGPIALGYYTIAYRILLLATDLMRTLSGVALPTFSRLQDDRDRLQRAYHKAIQLTSLTAFPTFLGLAALANELIPTLFGQQWTPSIPVMQILALIGIVHALNNIGVNVIKAMGRPDWNLRVNVINALLNVTAFVLVVRFGIVAVAAAYVIRGYLIPLPAFIWMAQKLLGTQLSTYLRQCRTPIVGAIAMTGAILGVKSLLLSSGLGVYERLAICGIVGAGVYLGAIALLEPPLFSQLRDLAKLASPKRSTVPKV